MVKARAHNPQGKELLCRDPEPWPEEVSGAELLECLVRTFTRFAALIDGAAVAFALWTVHAHAHEGAEVSPILALTSPEKRCGKTTVLCILGALVPRPLLASSITPAGVFRTVDQYHPTLLIDEADTYLGEHDELRGILNSGHLRRSAVVVRCEGDLRKPRAFSSWAPKAIALFGSLPGTMHDRAIVVPMRRRGPLDRIERLRLDRLEELAPLGSQAARWALMPLSLHW